MWKINKNRKPANEAQTKIKHLLSRNTEINISNHFFRGAMLKPTKRFRKIPNFFFNEHHSLRVHNLKISMSNVITDFIDISKANRNCLSVTH